MENSDVLIVTKLDRLGRDAMDVRKTVEQLAESDIRVHCLALGGVDLTSAAGKMTMQVISAVAEFEKDLLIERTHSGLARARAAGKRFGRPPALNNEQRQTALEQLKAEVSISAVARQFGTSRQTIMRLRDDMKHRRMALLELMLKHAQTRDLAELTEHLVTLLIAGYTTDEQLVTLMNWILQTGDTARPEEFLQELARRSPQHEEILMTIAQRLEQKGREEGRQEGIQLGEQRGIEKGRSEGEREATLKIARTMLQSGIDRNTVMAMTGLTAEDLQRITH